MDRWKVFSSGPAAILLLATDEQGAKNRWHFHETNPERPAKFMSATHYEIAFAKPGCGQFSDPLRGIAGKWHRILAAKVQHVSPWLQHARFVVRRHHRDQRWFRMRESGRERVEINDAARGSGDEPHTIAKPSSRGLQH